MSKICLDIDTKSLYYNIYNDNSKGHTATVATNYLQRGRRNPHLWDLDKIPSDVTASERDRYSDLLLKNSKSTDRINKIYVFSKIKVNGEIVDTPSSYCMYTKEEVDPDKYQYGRVKLHYPLNLRIDEMNIDNRAVLNAISDMYHGYAFIVDKFEYDTESGYLNFCILVVGYHNIPYTKVFISHKGVGYKLNSAIRNNIDIYDIEIQPLRRLYGDEVTTDNFDDYMNVGYSKAKELVKKRLKDKGAKNIEDISDLYPYSLFDFQYYEEGKIRYGIVSASYSTAKYFNLSYYQVDFAHDFNNVSIFVITRVGDSILSTIDEIKSGQIDMLHVASNSLRYIMEK